MNMMSIPDDKLGWLKKNKRKIIILSAILCVLAASVYLYTRRPTFSATYRIAGEDENRVMEVEVSVPAGSLVTMHKEKLFVQETVAPQGALVTANNAVSQQAGKDGKVIIRLFPGELKLGLNRFQFEVETLPGLKKNIEYTIEKRPVPITLKVDIKDEVIGGENIRRVTVVTDPLNTISVNGIANNSNLKTGREQFIVKNYSLLLASGSNSNNMPDVLDATIQVSVTDVDSNTKTESFPVKVPTRTNLNVSQAEETDDDCAIIPGQASPGAVISASGKTTVAGADGCFWIVAPLPVVGENTINVSASRPGENKSTCTVIVNRLMPKTFLEILSSTVSDGDLVIKGSATPGASVLVNGRPAAVSESKFIWSGRLPYGISKDLLFTVKVEKPGYRSSEQTVTIPRLPVLRQPEEQHG